MKTNSTSAEVLMIVLLVAPLAYLAAVWNELPAEIATHYNLTGKPDGWMRKETAALFMSGIGLFLYLVLRFLPKIDPKRQFQTANFRKLRLVSSLFFAVLTVMLFYMAMHSMDGSTKVSMLLVLISLMIAGLGNYMTTVKPNWFIGIRTPWTLESEEVWRKTHQLGGRLMVAGGLLAALLAVVVPMPYTVGAVVSVLLLSSLIPVVYSYVFFRQQKAQV